LEHRVARPIILDKVEKDRSTSWTAISGWAICAEARAAASFFNWLNCRHHFGQIASGEGLRGRSGYADSDHHHCENHEMKWRSMRCHAGSIHAGSMQSHCEHELGCRTFAHGGAAMSHSSCAH
jgi:hypothetical protein